MWIIDQIEMYHGMGGALLLVIVMIGVILWNIQRDQTNRIDLKDLICTNGELDDGKFFRFTTWMVSTWGFIYLMLDHKISEWYFAGYMAAWTGNALVNRWLSNKEPQKIAPPPPPGV